VGLFNPGYHQAWQLVDIHTWTAVALTAGARLGHYEIVALIGAGGMGEVYQARDTRLNRVVAIKVILDDLSSLPEARARFEREAQAIAALNHPHIATLHDVGRHELTDFLVMEWLDGETLSARLARGPLPLNHAVQYAVEIAAALDQAHRHGVTHRDLKPANIMLTKSGVKLLDFGLAKLRRSGKTSSVSVVATETEATSQGTILGTLQYMAPEQIEGAAVDARADIFAFGAVLYEMVTGQRAFEGKSRGSLMGSIMRDTPPPVSSVQRIAPVALDRLIATCLAKDPDDRWQSTRDLWRELKWMADSGAVDEKSFVPIVDGAGTRPALSVGLVVGIALIVAVVAAAAAWRLKPGAPAAPTPVARLTVALPPGDRMGNLGTPSIAISPDGEKLAYVNLRGNIRQLYVRVLSTMEANPVIGTEGASVPFFSPDGQWLGFFAEGKLKKIRLTGSAPETLCDAATGLGGTWGTDGTIYFVPFNATGLWKVSDAGGARQQVTTLDRGKGEVSHRWPQVLPGGQAVIFTVWTGPGSDERHLHLQMLTTGERRVLVQGASGGRYVASRHLLYSREDVVTAVPFDLATLQLNGQAVALGERVYDDEGPQFSVSESGIFAYAPVSAKRYQRQLVWVDSRGAVEPIQAPPRPYTDPMIAPDGRSVAFTNIGPIETIWIHDFSRRTQTSLTPTAAGSSQAPVWTSDGTRIVYRATRQGFRNLFWKAVDGSGDEERLTTSENVQTSTSASRDGKHIAFVDTSLGTGTDIWVLSLEAREPRVFLKTPSSEGSPRFSRDGRWLAYSSTESGAREVYVRPFPGPGGKAQISTDGGYEPVWSPTSRELFYRQGDRMMSAAIATAPALRAERPRLLFEGAYLVSDTGGAGYDVAADGRFLMVQPIEPQPAATAINLVINWFDDLRRRVPAGKR
jgi:Tol biopolymer transport system component